MIIQNYEVLYFCNVIVATIFRDMFPNKIPILWGIGVSFLDVRNILGLNLNTLVF